MSKYSDISKRIGWTGHCAIPCVKTAGQLRKSVIKNRCEVAFELVFKIQRFALSPEGELEIKAMQIIYEAYTAGKQIFKQL